jgi:predicted transposase YbfD/YdcC
VPSEKTLRSVPGRLDPAELSAAGFAYLKSLLPDERVVPAPLMPDSGPEREQRRAHQAAAQTDPVRPRRRAIAVDGTCLRGARRPDGSRVFVLSAVRHGDGITLASREIGAKTNAIPEFQPLLDQVDDADLAGAVITADALHAQHAHAAYLRERGAHYLLTIKNNQRGQARQLHRLPWKEVPVIHRDDARGHGRHERRRVQVVTVDGLPFPHARQVLRIQRKRRLYGAKKWSSETVYAITDLPAEQADAAEIATWARGHWTVENTVHWVRDVVFGEDKSQVRTRNTPAGTRRLPRPDPQRTQTRRIRQHRRRTPSPHRTPPRPRPLRHHIINRTSEANAGALREAILASNELRTVVEAAQLKAALRARMKGRSAPVESSASRDSPMLSDLASGDDLASEAHWLSRLAQAFAHSPVVAASVNERRSQRTEW